MANILCVGIATLDIVNEVAVYPAEDDEIRILSQEKRRGGNATNTAVVLSQLGHQCYWAGTLVNEVDCQTIQADLQHYNISQDFCHTLAQGKIPTSYITISRETGSRTICHYRDLPEYSFDEFKKINLSDFDWIHFEGRNITETMKMLAFCQINIPNTPISVEIEKNRENIEALITYADIVLFSRAYALTQHYSNAQEFCLQKAAVYPEKIITCAWGESGAGLAIDQQYYWQNAEAIKIIDTLGAGDVFNAGFIHQYLKQLSLTQCLKFACELATQKCGTKGLNIPAAKLSIS